MSKKVTIEEIKQTLGDFVYNTGVGETEAHYITIPVYAVDDYTSILARFLIEFGDDGMLDILQPCRK